MKDYKFMIEMVIIIAMLVIIGNMAYKQGLGDGMKRMCTDGHIMLRQDVNGLKYYCDRKYEYEWVFTNETQLIGYI